LFKGPWGRITAIDLNKGEHAWQVPLGVGPRDHQALKDVKGLPERLGSPERAALLCTKTLLFAGQGGKYGAVITAIREGKNPFAEGISNKPTFRAFDKESGELMAEITIPDNVTGAPMTYLHEEKQYIVFAVGGLINRAELIALAVP
jgi:quinoprotein glucose dehydrogenase